MLKAPERAKRRLAVAIGAGRAAAAAGLMSACALEDMEAWHGPVCFAPAGPADRDWLLERIAPNALVVLQQDGNLGQRINHVDRALRARGLARQIFIGTDCPALDRDYLLRAEAALQTHDAVLGPAEDGGVVLMGSGRPWPDLAGLAWSTPRLEDGLSAVCAALGWSVATLEPRADVDTVADLAAARSALRGDPRAARKALSRWLDREAACC
jgi:uncharacterized protein